LTRESKIKKHKTSEIKSNTPADACPIPFQLDPTQIIVVCVLNKIELKVNWKHDVQIPNLMNFSRFSNPPKLVSIEPWLKS